MKQPRSQIAGVIADQTLQGAINTKRYAQEVAAYLLSEHRVYELDSLLRDVQADWAAAGQVEVIATSAHELTAAVTADIAKHVKRIYPSAKRIIVSPVHDPQVIGGVRLSLANQQLDLSVAAKLNKFKQLTQTGKD